MRRHRAYTTLVWALGALAFFTASLPRARAVAEPYPGVTPVPQTTDAAVLHAFANEREIRERMHRGFVAIESDAWDVAAREFARVITLQPREPQASTAYYDLGIARAGLGDLDAAAAAFEEAIARDSGFLAARANLVTIDLRRNDLPAARRAAEALVAVAPDSARALYARGIVALQTGDARTALEDFRKLLVHDPQYAVAHYDLALAEQKLGAYADAERELRDAIAFSPGYARASLALGAVLLHEGKRDDARAAFDAAARSANDLALHNLAISFRDAIVR